VVARPRKSIEELELKGAFKKNPQRLRERLETPESPSGIGDPPDILTAPEKAIWIEVVNACAPGLLKSSDRWALKDFCRIEARFDKYGENRTGGNQSNKRAVTSKQMARRKDLLIQLGMTPASLVKIHIPKGGGRESDPRNEFVEFDEPQEPKSGQIN
jgi:hypothetical protein